MIMALSLFFLPGAAAQDIKKIAVFPFEVHSRANAALLQEALVKGLTSELLKSKNIQVVDKNAIEKVTAGRKMDEALALSAGRTLAADLVVIGRITEFGELISIDAKVIDVKQGENHLRHFCSGSGSEKHRIDPGAVETGYPGSGIRRSEGCAHRI